MSTRRVRCVAFLWLFASGFLSMNGVFPAHVKAGEASQDQSIQSGGTPSQPSMMLSRQDVINIVLGEFIPISPYQDSLVAFLYDPAGPDSVLFPGQVVASWDSSVIRPIMSETYLVWLDDEPGQDWTHHSTFLFVDAFVGSLAVMEAESWPVVDTLEVTRFMEEGNSSPEKFLGNYQTSNVLFDYTPVATTNTSDWAIIVVGKNLTGNGEKEARVNDVDRIKEILNGANLGPKVDKNNISVVDGGDSLGATAGQICAAIHGLDSKCDKLYFFYVGHGSKSGMITKVAGKKKSHTLKYKTLACKLIETGIKEVCVVIEACHSGASIKPMKKKKVPTAAGGNRKLKGTVVTSSSKAKTTPRIDGDGTPFIKGLNSCFKDPLSNLNMDGETDLLEAVAWAKAQAAAVAKPDPQGAVLGDGRDVVFPKPLSNTWGNSEAGNKLTYERKKIWYRIKKGSSAGKDTVICRETLYVEAPNKNVEYRARRSVTIFCKMKGGGVTVIRNRFKPMLGKGQRLCLGDVPKGCKRVVIKRIAPGKIATLAVLPDTLSPPPRKTRAAYYSRGEFIFQEHEVTGLPGEIHSSSVDSIAGWQLLSQPAIFEIPALLDTQVVLVRGQMPDSAIQGADIVSQVVNESVGDTTELAVQALLFDAVPGDIVDGDSFSYQALDVLGGLLSSSGLITLDNTVARLIAPPGGVPVFCLVDSSGALIMDTSTMLPDSGTIYSLVVRGGLDWHTSTLVAPSPGLVLDSAVGSIFSGGVLRSQGDGLTVTGDVSGLGFNFFLVDSSATNGAVFDGASGAMFRNLTVEHSGTFDVVLRNTSAVELRDAVFDSGLVDVGSGSQLTRSWTTHVVCSDVAGDAVEGALVRIRDLSGTMIDSSFTDSLGFTHELSLVQYVQNGAVSSPQTPHEIRVSIGAFDTLLTYTANDQRAIEIIIPGIGTGIGDEERGMPTAFRLYPNVPNPFNPATRIEFALPHRSQVRLEIFNAAGQRIRLLAHGRYEAGVHTAIWNGRNDNGRSVGSGVYFYRLDTGTFLDTRKLVLVR